MHLVDDVLWHGELGEFISMNFLAACNIHEVVPPLAVEWMEAYFTGTLFLVGVASTIIHVVISTKFSFKIVTIYFSSTKYNTS